MICTHGTNKILITSFEFFCHYFSCRFTDNKFCIITIKKLLLDRFFRQSFKFFVFSISKAPKKNRSVK